MSQKKYIFLFLFSCLTGIHSLYANHLKGGWIQYTFISHDAVNKTSKYQITVKQYLDCSSTSAQRDQTIFLGIFDGNTNSLWHTLTVPLSGSDYPNKTSYSACISQPPPKVCYIIDRYITTVDLPDNAAGYILAVQRCCRIANIRNLSGNTNTIGITYYNKIPGTINGVDYSNNSSPVFAQKDTAVICYNSPFTFDFSATDADGDKIVYSFCDGLTGGDSSPAGAQPNPPANPPYAFIPYAGPNYSGSSPLGSQVTIDPNTGLISGIAPSITGDYVIAVCANEYRNNELIGSTKKEIHITVADCSVSAASLQPSYITCNGTVLTFQNQSTNSNIVSYTWDFGVPTMTTDTSSQPTPTFDYQTSGKDSGTYTVKLKVGTAGGCQDSTTAIVKVYPGFLPDFSATGSCYLNVYQFKDATISKYGSVNTWAWNFGDNTTLADTAHSQDSAWKYPAPTTASVRLIVTNTKGCQDTVTKSITISDQPSLNLAFHDTLICSIDTLALKANYNSGSINWMPSTGPNSSRIIGRTTNSPLVYPQDTTSYIVTVNDNGCINSDTVTVNVLPYITVDAGPDTGICRTDFVQLKPVSQALSYRWTDSLNNLIATTKNPSVQPLVTTRYYVTANLGKCQANDSVRIRVAPYPQAQLGADTTICFGSRLQLKANITGTSFYWQPTASLINENTLSPIAGPDKTTAYILLVTDTVGCPKPSTDTLIVTVIPPLQVNAGNDTTVAANQPVQLQATGATNYYWSPSTFLNDPNTDSPIATPDNSLDSIRYKVQGNTGTCYGTDYVTLRIIHGQADILVPSAFTPNGDGRNDVIRPVLIGITKLGYFSIYNRWGQMLFTTSEPNKGWDGYFSGVAQPPGTYVYQTFGTDYNGKPIFRKGTVVLIR